MWPCPVRDTPAMVLPASVPSRYRSGWLRPRLALGWVVGTLVLLSGAAPTPAIAQEGGSGCLPVTAVGQPAASPALPTGPTRIADSRGGVVELVGVPAGIAPYGIAVDATDTYGRVYVADRGSDRLTVLFGRAPAPQVACVLSVGTTPYGVAVDASTGRALVTLRGEPRLVVVDGRGDQPRVVDSVMLPSAPGWVTIDQQTRRAFVSLPELGQVAVIEPAGDGRYQLVATLDAGPFVLFVAVDQATGRLVVSNEGQPPTASGDQGKGTVMVFDGRAAVPTPIGDPIPASDPLGIAFDPVSHDAYVLENGTDQLLTLGFPGGGPATVVSRIAVGPVDDPLRNSNPVDLVLLPASRELVVTQFATNAGLGGHLDVIQLGANGVPTFDRTVPAAQHTTGIALDPVTGRVFVSAVDEGRVAGYRLDQQTAAPPPAQVAESLPGPLDVSFAPADVARTVGLSLLVLLLVGAPTPLFNETLESNLDEIHGWFRRLRPGGGSRGRLAGIGARLGRFSTSAVGIAIYVVAASLIYAFLTPGFPSQNGPLVFGVAVLSLGIATLADILPGDRYVLRTYQAHGTIRIATWTLGLAAVCVLISRLSGMQPGYMYGIIGTFTFTVALGRIDEGRMEARGAVALLALALVAWFARIPFQPTPGVPTSGASLIINSGLVGIFVVAVEGLVFGLIPLQFLPGRKIFAWSRWRWLVLWGSGLALFAHVLVYPVTVAQPNPDPASLTTTLVSVAIYGAIAIVFWGAFRWRAQQRAGGGEGGEGGEHAAAAAGSGE